METTIGLVLVGFILGCMFMILLWLFANRSTKKQHDEALEEEYQKAKKWNKTDWK